jgi:hypothetical protein
MANRVKGVLLALVLGPGLAAVAEAQVVDHRTGFTGQTDMTLNGTPSAAVVVGSNLQVTDSGGSEAKSAFRTAAIPVDKFRTTFTFHQLPGSSPTADGMGFCIQGNGPTALGAGGGDLGYKGILKSVLVKFDLYSNAGEGVDSTGLYENGVDPFNVGSIDLTGTIDLHSQHDMTCVMDYDGTKLTVTITDLTTNVTATQTYTVNVVGDVGAATGFVGFTGGTGGLTAVQEILNWTYVTAPTGLTATPGVNSAALNWTAVTGATGYNILRLDPGAAAPLQIGTTTNTTFTDPNALWPNGYTYYVQALVGAFNGPNTTVPCNPLPPPITVSPAGPITTTETGGNAVLTLQVNVVPTALATVTITSSNTQGAKVGLAGQAGAQTLQINIPANTPVNTTFPFTVYGVDDFIANDPQTYTITITVAGGGYTNQPTLTVNGTTLEGDVAALVVNPLGGLLTDTNGGQATFTVALESQPASGAVSVSVTSSNTTEGTVSTSVLNFSSANWMTPQPVVVTGQGVNITYLNTPYTVNLAVQAGSSAEYLGMVATVSLTNLHLEIPPALPKVWGKCGLLGLEGFFPLALLYLGRRRRRSGGRA